MMEQTQIQQLERTFNRNEAALARWKSDDGMLASLLARDMRLIHAAVWMSLRVSWSDGAAKRGMQALEILAHEGIISSYAASSYCAIPL